MQYMSTILIQNNNSKSQNIIQMANAGRPYLTGSKCSKDSNISATFNVGFISSQSDGKNSFCGTITTFKPAAKITAEGFWQKISANFAR